MKIPPSTLRKATRRQHPPARSALEGKFLRMWESLDGPKLIEQFRFHPDREWRFDFAYVNFGESMVVQAFESLRVGIELQGGIHNRGRHVRGKGYAGDAEKYRAAAKLGWLVWPLTADDITGENLVELIEFCRGNG